MRTPARFLLIARPRTPTIDPDQLTFDGAALFFDGAPLTFHLL